MNEIQKKILFTTDFEIYCITMETDLPNETEPIDVDQQPAKKRKRSIPKLLDGKYFEIIEENGKKNSSQVHDMRSNTER